MPAAAWRSASASSSPPSASSASPSCRCHCPAPAAAAAAVAAARAACSPCPCCPAAAPGMPAGTIAWSLWPSTSIQPTLSRPRPITPCPCVCCAATPASQLISGHRLLNKPCAWPGPHKSPPCLAAGPAAVEMLNCVPVAASHRPSNPHGIHQADGDPQAPRLQCLPPVGAAAAPV